MKQQLEVFTQSFNDYAIFFSLGTWSAGGMMVMIKYNLSIIDVGVDHFGRIAYIKIINNNFPIILVSVYVPTEVNERCEFSVEFILDHAQDTIMIQDNVFGSMKSKLQLIFLRNVLVSTNCSFLSTTN